MSGLNQLKRNLSDLTTDPRAYLEMLADRMRNSVMGERAVAGDQGAGMVQLTPQERREQIQGAMLDNSGQGVMGGALGIIKGKGGNWLNGSVENALSGLKKPVRASVEPPYEVDLKSKALNNWIEGPLTKYIKRDMATEGDPVRKVAEQGVLHIPPETTRMKYLSGLREITGFKKQPTLTRPESQYWNDTADSVFAPALKKDWTKEAQLERMDPRISDDDMVYGFTGATDKLGFKHLTDELSNALNPESGLPRQLLLTPEQIQQMGMEKAVRHVANINAWRAAQKAEANAALAQSPAVHGVREYAENNPKGLRWVELKQPAVESDLPYGSVGDPAAEARRHLQEQLKYEGDTMGHCVGKYCDDVVSGKSRIFSLRDAKGEPHVTIETAPQYSYGTNYLNAQRAQAEKEALEQGLDPESSAFSTFRNQRMEELAKENLPTDIVQIKGKQNKKPNDEYLPFVQDFVKNHPEGGAWGDVEDLQNTGLVIRANGVYELDTPANEAFRNSALDEMRNDYANGGLVEPKWEQCGDCYILR